MEASPAISIIAIFHNPAPFFEEAIESVLAQTYADWELLLVDDGSTDGSEEVARRYVSRHPDQIRYLHHPGRVNQGTGPTRNLGIASARGRYLTEMDADDVWLPGFLASKVRVLEERPDIDMVFAPVQRWYSWTGDTGDEARDWVARPWPAYDTVMEPPNLIPLLLEHAPAGGVPKGLLIRTELVRRVDAYPPEFADMYEDQALLCKLGLVARTYVLPEWDYRYRRHAQSMVTVMNRTQDRRLLRLKFLEWFADYLEAEGIRDKRVWEPLERELWKCRNPGLERARTWADGWWRRIRRRSSRMWRGRGVVD
jgi:glycosyltransferase involved in cell wall biosynthesis